MAASDLLDKFNYVYSCDLDTYVYIKIGTLEGKRDRKCLKALVDDPVLKFSGLYESEKADLFVSCKVYDNNVELTLPTRTSYKPFSRRWNWNEWIKLPIKYSDLPRNAQIAITIWDIYGSKKAIPVGATTVSLFGKNGIFRRGIHDFKVWPDVEADGKVNTTTPGKMSDDCSQKQMMRLSKLSKKHRKGRMKEVDWLDRLAFREIEQINEKEKRDSNMMFLMVEFPRIHRENDDYCIVYFEKDATSEDVVKPLNDIIVLPDPELECSNLAEMKHHKLMRALRTGTRELKPNAEIRDLLNIIMNYPPTKFLTADEEDLIWRFRFYLSSYKKALPKFLRCVKWDTPQEAKQALELLEKWSPMDFDDALELLSTNYKHEKVRGYAVARLWKADDEHLLLYLLQLVQALKYENLDSIICKYQKLYIDDLSEPMSRTVIDTIITNKQEFTQGKESVEDLLKQQSKDSSPLSIEEEDDEELAQDLSSFLIYRACKNDTLANYFYWYLHVECEDPNLKKSDKIAIMYKAVMKMFMNRLNNGGYKYKMRARMMHRQQKFIDKLLVLMSTVVSQGGNRKKKIERLRVHIKSMEFTTFDPLQFPLDPNVHINGIIADKASLFKSNLMPGRLPFKTVDDHIYVTIFKNGDDLRQDQLILQIITLMDKLLRMENLDLKLTPYKVLATSTTSGFVQYITSTAVAEVLGAEGSIQNFFRKHNPSEGAPYSINPEVMDTYVKSCAGYCIITYLLGIGDRHLDNLLLTKSGNLFHIDFGYILGRDPKPFPPPMKLSKEMVEGMGGQYTEHYQEFRQLCYTAFLHLRRSANLILNLFSLMLDANVPDIAMEPDKTMKKVQDKFVLDLSDEEAVKHIQSLIDESVTALFPVVVEHIHKVAQYWRK